MMKKLLAIASIAVLGLAGAALAKPDDDLVSGTVIASSGSTIVIDTPAGERSFVLAEGAVGPAALGSGDFVLVRLSEPGSESAEQILIVDERVDVTAEVDEERAVLGTVTAASPDQLLVETSSGGQAFVVDPEKLFPPLPAPGKRIAVTYRTLEVKPPLHMATGLVELPADFQFLSGSVRETSEPIEVAHEPPIVEEPQVAQAIPPPAPAPAPVLEQAPQRLESLPQTGTSVPLAAAAALLLIGFGVASRFSR